MFFPSGEWRNDAILDHLGPEIGLQARLHRAARRIEKLHPPSVVAIRPMRNGADRMSAATPSILALMRKSAAIVAASTGRKS